MNWAKEIEIFELELEYFSVGDREIVSHFSSVSVE